jgi:pimeloyl-ACP methyl ester carboxylesterase
MVNERAFFFREDDRPLFGMLYSPESRTTPSGPRRGVVICGSLFEEKFWCERVFANLGRHLAGKGFEVLVFDYFGYGNSTGHSIDVDVTTLEQDINDACDLLANSGVTRITLLGVRWGAALACRAAARDDVDSIFLVNPVKKWKPEFMKALRANVAGQYAIFKKTEMTREEIIHELTNGGDCVRSGYGMNNVEGYFFSRSFLEQSQEITLSVSLPDNVKSVTIITIPEKKTPRARREDQLAQEFQAGGVNCDNITLTEDNAFWINNEFFTSITPDLYREITERLEKLQEDASDEPADIRAEPAVFETFVKDGVRETAVNFDSRDGNRLYGVLYVPAEGEKKDPAFLFSHGGLVGMNGAYRFHTRLARKFAKAGFPCLCFDPHGMGRAQGSHHGKDRAILFREINLGLLSDDVGDAAAFLKDIIGEIKVALFGVCGGAITNIIAHGRFNSIDASIQLSVPVMLPSLSGGIVRMSAGFAKFYLRMYVRKIFNPVAWWRFISFQSDYEKIFKALNAAAGGVFNKIGFRKKTAPRSGNGPDPAEKKRNGRKHAKKTTRPTASSDAPQPTPDEGLRFNDAYLDAYRKIIERGDRIVFFYGENDNFKWEFNNEFAEKYPKDLEAGKNLFVIEEIKQANHMYTLREWQDEIYECCLRWAENTTLSREPAVKT